MLKLFAHNFSVFAAILIHAPTTYEMLRAYLNLTGTPVVHLLQTHAVQPNIIQNLQNISFHFSDDPKLSKDAKYVW